MSETPNTSRVAHFILMRFNVRTKHRAEPRDAAIRSRDKWLDTRFDLFEDFCWPTLTAQSSKNFEIHIYFDEQTPSLYLERIARITEQHPFVKVLTCDYFDNDIAVARIKSRLMENHRFVLTTRLDNDDGLHRDFVRIVQREMPLLARTAINFPIGLVVSGKGAYRSQQRSNAFISVLEEKTDFKTVLQVSHNQVDKIFATKDVECGPMWLQHVHGGNVSNKTRGQRLTLAALPLGFESVQLADRIEPISRARAAAENWTAGLFRASRDLAARSMRTLRLR